MEMKFVFYDMIEKVFNSEFEEINEILINKRKELGNDIDVDKDISNILVTIKDNELNILDSSQKKYTNNIRVDNINNVALELKDNILNIKINNENEFSEYKFDLKTKKLTWKEG